MTRTAADDQRRPVCGAADAALVLVDALNVAYWCGNPPQLRLPLALLQALAARDLSALLCFDASTPHRLADDDSAAYARLRTDADRCVEVASGTSADTYLLERARATGARIISRDRFRQHHRRHRRLIHDPQRLLAGWVSQERLYVPGLDIDVPLPERGHHGTSGHGTSGS